jgi:glycosyltransferase involved in cell wall biosynthesis
MHVAYIHQHFTTKQGFAGTRSYEMSQRLIHAGHRVTMICGQYGHGGLMIDPAQRVNELDVDGIRVLCVAEPYANQMTFARRIVAFLRFARTASALIIRLNADLVFATSTPLTVGIPGMKGARRLRVPFVFEVRDLWPELLVAMGALRNPLLIWYARRLERRIYRAADAVIALAPGIKEGICNTGYPPKKVTVIPNSSDVDLFRPDDAPLVDDRFGPADDFRLVFTGAHGMTNGLDAVLDTVAELKRRSEKGLRFVFIGWGQERERLMARSRRENLDSMISWVSSIPKEELARILPRMNVGLMTLKNVPAFGYSTSPNKFFDYIACGLPVLNNYPGWLADLIHEHQCGLVVPPDDPSAFADAVVKLRDHREECCRMGRRGRQLAETRFSRDLLGQMFVRTLEEAHAAGRAVR